MAELLTEYKTEHRRFKDRVINTPLVDLPLQDYLNESLQSGKEGDLCRGWDYLKTKLTEDLKIILLEDLKYWAIAYNSGKADYILNQLYPTEEINRLFNPQLIKQLNSFVYVWNDIKRECDQAEREANLKEALEKEGYKEIIGTEQELNTLKVVCVLDVTTIGLLGSFDKKAGIEGRLCWSDYYKALMIIPKKCRTRGHIIKNKAYIKEIK